MIFANNKLAKSQCCLAKPYVEYVEWLLKAGGPLCCAGFG